MALQERIDEVDTEWAEKDVSIELSNKIIDPGYSPLKGRLKPA